MKHFLLFPLLAVILLGAGCAKDATVFSLVKKDPASAVLANATYAEPVAIRGGQTIVRPSDLFQSGEGISGQPAIEQPTFVGITEAVAEEYLFGDLLGIVLNDGDTTKFYPYQILAWHEVVKDTVNNEPVSILYSSLIDLALPVQGHDYTGSGVLWNSDQLFLQEGGNLSSLLLRKTVYGPNAGETLAIPPHRLMTWDTYQSAYPDGLVLSSNTGFDRAYEAHPLAGYLTNDDVLFPRAADGLRVIPPKAILYGVDTPTGAKAYAYNFIRDYQKSVKNDFVGGAPYVTWIDRDGQLRVNARSSSDVPEHLFTGTWNDGLLENGRVRWTLQEDGSLMNGETVLAAFPVTRTFWFAWTSTRPETELYARLKATGIVDGVVTNNPETQEDNEGPEGGSITIEAPDFGAPTIDTNP